MTANAALNVVPTPRARPGELAHPGLEPTGAESNRSEAELGEANCV